MEQKPSDHDSSGFLSQRRSGRDKRKAAEIIFSGFVFHFLDSFSASTNRSVRSSLSLGNVVGHREQDP